MPKRICRTPAETAQLCTILHELHAPVHVLGRTVSCPDTKAWQHAIKRLAAQQKLREVADRYIKQERLI